MRLYCVTAHGRLVYSVSHMCIRMYLGGGAGWGMVMKTMKTQAKDRRNIVAKHTQFNSLPRVVYPRQTAGPNSYPIKNFGFSSIEYHWIFNSQNLQP